MRGTHRILELAAAALCIGFVALIGVTSASGDPPDGKGGGGPPGDPVESIWIAWHDPAMDAWGDPGMPDYDPNTGLYYPTAPWIEDMGSDVQCVMDAHPQFETSDDYIAYLEQNGRIINQGFNYEFGDPALDPCPDCPGCAFVQPSVDPDGLVPTEYPLSLRVACHITVEEGVVYCNALISGKPDPNKKKEVRYATGPVKVKGFINTGPNSFRMVIREPAVQIAPTSGPDEGIPWGWISLGDVFFEKYPAP